MLAITLVLFNLARIIFLSSAIDPPSECRFINSVHDSPAETALLEYFDKSEPFEFSETNFFQPQCLLCEIFRGEVCFGYKGGTSYGVTSGTINTVRLVTNLPYIYALGENVGTTYTTVTAIAALREDLTIPYRTLIRFKGITTLDPVVTPKRIVLRLGMKCLPGDTREHLVTVTGGVYDLIVRLFVNMVDVNATNGFTLDGYSRARINCASRTATVEFLSAVPDESACSEGCLGPEFCLTYQPEYAATRETWCPLTSENWISIPPNALRLPASDSSLPLHIFLERELLKEQRFTLMLNSNWFIDYAGVLTISVPEARPGQSANSVWKILLPSTGQRPSNHRIVLLYNCRDVRIRYETTDHEHFQATVTFVDMRSNSTFTVKDNLDQAKKVCHEEILVATTNGTSTTATTSSSGQLGSSTPWYQSGVASSLRSSFTILLLFNPLFMHHFWF